MLTMMICTFIFDFQESGGFNCTTVLVLPLDSTYIFQKVRMGVYVVADTGYSSSAAQCVLVVVQYEEAPPAKK